MYALVLFICYLDGYCENKAIEIFKSESQCLVAMTSQRIRRGGCFPIDKYMDPFWHPASEYSDRY